MNRRALFVLAICLLVCGIAAFGILACQGRDESPPTIETGTTAAPTAVQGTIGASTPGVGPTADLSTPPGPPPVLDGGPFVPQGPGNTTLFDLGLSPAFP
jgi:hypothetical protein